MEIARLRRAIFLIVGPSPWRLNVGRLTARADRFERGLPGPGRHATFQPIGGLDRICSLIKKIRVRSADLRGIRAGWRLTSLQA